MNVEELIVAIAAYFNKCVEDSCADNFKELKELYDWTPDDIREEIVCCLRDFSNTAYSEWQAANPDADPFNYLDKFDYGDDGSVWDSEVSYSYRELKKRIMQKVR